MATITAEHTRSAAAERDPRWGSWLMGAAAVGFIGYAVIFFIRNFTDAFLELGIGPNEVNVGRDQIREFSPSLFHYIGHLHIAVSGFIAATGVAVLFLVAYGVRRGQLWAWVGATVAPVLGLLVALPDHYPNNFDTLGHLGLIYLATAIFAVGALWPCAGCWPGARRRWASGCSGGAPRRSTRLPRGKARHGTDGDLALPEMRRRHRWLEVRHLRLSRTRARRAPPARRLGPVLHVAVRGLPRGGRALQLRLIIQARGRPTRGRVS